MFMKFFLMIVELTAGSSRKTREGRQKAIGHGLSTEDRNYYTDINAQRGQGLGCGGR